MTDKALVLFSGGQDSTTCLAWALERYSYVETIGFDYGQRHRVELDCRPRVIDSLRQTYPMRSSILGDDHVLDMGILGKISETALTRDAEITLSSQGLPSTFVPARNLVFLTFAAAVAYRRNLNVLVGGMCETDYSGYPDCRDNTLKATQVALSLGMDTPMRIETPLMWLDKAQTWRLAEQLGGQSLLEIIAKETHTCYLGDRATLHDWGYGCGTCPACELRSRGFAEWKKAA